MMRHVVLTGICGLGALAFLVCSCAQESTDRTTLREYAVNDVSGLTTTLGVELDSEISADGGGSLRVTAVEPRTIDLYQLREIEDGESQLIYQAKLRTEEFDGRVYPEIRCELADGKVIVARGLPAALSETEDWTTVETALLLLNGHVPETVVLALVLEGTGVAWIDDISLFRGPPS